MKMEPSEVSLGKTEWTQENKQQKGKRWSQHDLKEKRKCFLPQEEKTRNLREKKL